MALPRWRRSTEFFAFFLKNLTLASSSLENEMIDFVREKTDNGTLVMRASGRLDNDTQQYFFECVKDEIQSGNNKIVLNFEELGYISSVGLSTLVRASSEAAKDGGTIYLAKIENRILDVLNMVKFDKIFNIYGTEEEAVDAMDSHK